ncbi:MAG: hypothetical protein ABI678_17305 [Kofleriaceae bacterium]
MSFPRALLVALALLQALGISELIRRQTCEETCRRDGCADDCTPGDDTCPCHCLPSQVATTQAITVVTDAPPMPATDITFDARTLLHPSPDPREILHVPRPAV